jgi:CRISPR/Cas system-associated exonuclease Cas4 (RecB family)
VLLASGVAILGISVLWLRGIHAQRRAGRLQQSDLPGRPGELLRGPRWRMVGRPDEVRELADGRWVPVEFKSRTAPRRGPPFSHRIQVVAYCALLEETTGRSPPFGAIVYGDGTEFRIGWDDVARSTLLSLRREIDRPYDGRARPSLARCRRCPWNEVCDRRATGA